MFPNEHAAALIVLQLFVLQLFVLQLCRKVWSNASERRLRSCIVGHTYKK